MRRGIARNGLERSGPGWPRRATATVANVLGAAVVVVGAGACSTDPGTASDPDATEWIVASTPLLAIGEVDGADPYTFSRIAGVRLLDDGGVAVADGASSQIRVFDASGAVRTVSGRAGDGPGEFRWINDLRYYAPDTLVVFDAQLWRTTPLRTDGTTGGTPTTFRADDGWVELYLGRFDDGSHALAWIRQDVAREATVVTPDRMTIARFDETGAMLGEIASDVGMRRLRSPVPFSPHFLGTVVGDVVIHADGAAPLLRRTDASGTALTPLEVETRAWSLDEAWEALRAHVDSSSVTAFEEIRSVPGADSVSYMSEILVDDTDRLWVKTYDPAVDSHWRGRRRTGGVWLVLEPDGSEVARVRVPAGFRVMDVRGDRVAGVSRDDLGVEYVEVRALRR